MKIRKATIQDIAQLSNLFDAYRVYYKKNSDIQGAKEFLLERMNNNDAEIFVAEKDDQYLTGFVQLYPLFSSTRMQKLWLLNDLFVSIEYRGQGVSKQLIDASKTLAIDTKACGLMLETTKSNFIGNNLYPATGFELNTSCNFYEWDV